MKERHYMAEFDQRAIYNVFVKMLSDKGFEVKHHNRGFPWLDMTLHKKIKRSKK